MWFTPQGIQNWPKFLNRGKPNHSKLTRKCFNFGTSLFSTTADSYQNIVWVSTISDKKSWVKVMSHGLAKRYLYGFNGIGTRFCSSFKSVSIVSRTHRVDFDICSDIDRFYKANSYSTYYSLTLCQLKCTWSQSNPLEYQSIRSISDENLSF